MTVQILGDHITLILKDGTLAQIDEAYSLIWFHPTGRQETGSYRLNLRLKNVDVQIGKQTNGEPAP